MSTNLGATGLSLRCPSREAAILEGRVDEQPWLLPL